MKIVLTVLVMAALVWGAAQAQASFRFEQYSESVRYPSVFVPNCPDALYAATSAFVQLEYNNAKASAPLQLGLESAAYRVMYNAQYALGFALEMELSLIVTPDGVQLKTAYSSSSVPDNVSTQMLWDYANQVSKRQLEWIVRNVRAEPCRFNDPNASSPATLAANAPIVDGLIRFSKPTEVLSDDYCDTWDTVVFAHFVPNLPALLTNLEPISAGCAVIRDWNYAAFKLELAAQMKSAGFTLISVTEYSQLWRSGNSLVWLRFIDGTTTATVLNWQRFKAK